MEPEALAAATRPGETGRASRGRQAARSSEVGSSQAPALPGRGNQGLPSRLRASLFLFYGSAQGRCLRDRAHSRASPPPGPGPLSTPLYSAATSCVGRPLPAWSSPPATLTHLPSHCCCLVPLLLPDSACGPLPPHPRGTWGRVLATRLGPLPGPQASAGSRGGQHPSFPFRMSCPCRPSCS